MALLLTVLLVLIAAYLFILRGRTTRGQDYAAFDGWLYAHRGYHTLEGEDKAPENSRKAFRRAVERGYGAELDVHLLADGTLAVFHDSDLMRVAKIPGVLEDLTADQLNSVYLENTDETIPTMQEVLDIFDGKTPLIIEIKTYHGNHAALCKALCELLDGYKGLYCLESFDPFAVIWLAKNRPDMIRGQLSSNFIKDRNNLKLYEAVAETYLLLNFLSKPDFVAYNFKDRHNLSNVICRDVWHMRGASWTLRSQAELDAALREDLWPIFEGFEPEEI